MDLLARPVKLIVHMDSSRLVRWTVPPLSRTVAAYRLHERVVASYLTKRHARFSIGLAGFMQC